MAENDPANDLVKILSEKVEGLVNLTERLQGEIDVLQANEEQDVRNLNSMFLCICGAFVMFMQCGFGFLEAGSTREKNVTNILIKNVLDLMGAGFIYWAVGWGFAYGDIEDHPPCKFIGATNFFSTRLDDTVGSEEYPAQWFFQMVFAATASTIVNGAIAERVQFSAYLTYSLFITGFVYPVVSHWGWSGTGWLANPPESAGMPAGVAMQDFAGSGIVHCTGGIAALVATIMMGPRIGRFDKENGKTKAFNIPGHSVPFTVLGGFILFLGFLAFNGGSELAIVSRDGGVAGEHGGFSLAIMNTIISGSAGGIIVLFIHHLRDVVKGEHAYWSVLYTVNGGLAGMVAACAGCDRMHQWAAFVIGLIAGANYYLYSELLVKLRIDDLLDAFPVHFGGGIVGLLMTPVFMYGGIIYSGGEQGCYMDSDGVLRGDDVLDGVCQKTAWYNFAWNIVALLAICLWVSVMVGILMGIFAATGMLRVSEDVEINGMDVTKHGEPAYPAIAKGHGYETEISGRVAKNC